MSFNECEICGYTGDQVVLKGGFIADLCKAHRNAWHEYVIQAGPLQEHQGLEAEIAAAARGGRHVLARGSALLLHDCESELFKLAKAWVTAQQNAKALRDPSALSEPKAEGDTA